MTRIPSVEVARHRQRHAGNARLRSRIGHLPDLTFECRNRRGIDHHAAFAIGVRP